MSYLLDVNVLIALIDPLHVANDRAGSWITSEGLHGWATCPIVQNGVIRIVGNPNYPNSPGGTSVVASVLFAVLASPDHTFWADDCSLLDDQLIDRSRLASHKHLTDTYLLALAVRNGGRLVTFDRKISADAVIDGKAALLVI